MGAANAMAPMRETLDELTKAAAALNKETDELNGVLEDIEDELAGAGVGMTVWLGYALADSNWTEEYDEHTDRTWEESTAWDLGYEKLEDGWRIAAKRVKLRRNTGDMEWESFDLPTPGGSQGGPIPLAKAPRLVRMEAAAHLEDLLKVLIKKMREYQKDIAEAKKLVKS